MMELGRRARIAILATCLADFVSGSVQSTMSVAMPTINCREDCEGSRIRDGGIPRPARHHEPPRAEPES